LAAPTSVSGTGSSDLVQLLFKQVDKNGDQKISADEFTTFLTGLLGKSGSTGASSGASSSAGLDPHAASTEGLPFAPISGFDFAKLTDSTHVSEKYTASVRLFSQALAATGAAPNATGLQSVADWLNAHGATASVASDKISINGDSPVDCITDFGGSSSMWWFQNTP
jgi:hypothetical protein